MYEDTKSTDALLNVLADTGELVGIGIPSWYIDKVMEKTGLDKVFDELRSDKTAEEYARNQAAIKNLRDTTSAFFMQKGLDALNNYLSEHRTLDPVFNLFSGGSADPAVNKNFHYAATHDPLAIDLNGNGIQTTGATGSVMFDMNGNGIKHATGWVSPDDGLLVMDRNGNGTIDNGSELFGENTVKKDGSFAKDGLDALADLDGNGDGVIDANDAAYKQIMVWQDKNQDGISQADELHHLSDLGIASLSVAGTAKNTDLVISKRLISKSMAPRSTGATPTS